MTTEEGTQRTRQAFSAYDGPVVATAVALGGLTLVGLLHPTALTLAHSLPLNVAITAAALVVALGATYFAVTEYLLSGLTASLYVGLAFLLLAAASAGTGLAPVLGGWRRHFGPADVAWAIQQALAGLLLVRAGLMWEHTNRSRGRNFAYGAAVVAAVALALAAWVVVARAYRPPLTVHDVTQVIAGILFLIAAILFWRAGHAAHRLRFVWLALVLSIGGFSQLQYATHPFNADLVQAGDILRLIFYAGVLLSLLAEWGRGYRVLRAQTRELEVVHSLMTAPSVREPAAVIRHATYVIGQALGGDVRVVLSGGRHSLVAEIATAQPVTFAEGERVGIATALEAQGRRLGTLIVTRASDESFGQHDLRLLEAFGAQCSILLERSLLYEEVAAGAVVEERSRLAREIHDGLAQHLAFLKMRVAWLQRASTVGPDQLRDIEGVLTTALTEARQAITMLRSDLGEATTAEAVAGYAREFGQISGLGVVVQCEDGVPDLRPRARVELLRIVQEALNNVRKHAVAQSVQLTVEGWHRGVRVTIADDGRGFEPEAVGDGHFGTDIMRERASGIGGWLEIHSDAGQGTQVVVWVPAEEAESLIS